jgi:hypothetical protein
MPKIIAGRIREKEILHETLSSHRSELVAVYGRRRIGKTYLIREYFKDQIIFSFTGLSEGKRDDQIKNFMLMLNEVTANFKKEKNPEDWLEAFSFLKQHLKTIRKTKKKKVIFIDEFPWVDTQRSGFLAAFENFWNDYCTTRSDLIVVICGSTASYMVRKIIQNHKGLSKRITQTILLKPFTLYETKEFFKYKGIPIEEMELLKLYMALGGVAEYLEHVNTGESSVVAIQRLCFQEGAYLENEFEEVFKALFDDGSHHHKIMLALAKNNKKGINREIILDELGLKSGGRFSEALNELIYSGFVLKYEAYEEGNKSTLYRIYDEFCLFYIQFMKKHKKSKWTQLYQKQEYKTWCGYSFETICLKHSEAIKKALRCDQIESKNYSWNNSKAQVDLVIDRNDDVINLCEIKFYKEKFTIDEAYLEKLRNKENHFRNSTETKKGISTVLMTTWGVTENKYSKAIVSNNLTKDCLFAEI